MNKLTLGIIGTMVAGLATLWVIQHQAQINLREENESLQQRLDQMNQLEAENERLSNLVARANGSLSDEQLKDLLRLRSEVGSLRQQTNELARLQEENRRLQTTLTTSRNLESTNSPPAAAPENIFPKESWAFAGYVTPEAALESFAWAVSKGDTKTMLASLTPDVQKEFEKEFQGKSESEIVAKMAEGVSKTTAYRVLRKDFVSDDLILLDVYDDGDNTTGKIKMQRIGNEWKFAGPVEDN